VRFTDDALSSQRGWFEEFAHRYPREIGLPYSVNDHPHNIDADIARLYRNSGCIALSMGIESGNPYIRKQIMRRPFSNEVIIHAFRQIKKAGIDTSAFNIVGVPFETMSTILDTIKLNAQCSPVRYANAYFQPFLETEAAKMCYEAGWKIKELPGSFFEEPVVELPGISREQVIFGFKYFGLLVLWYKLLYRLSAEGGENAAMRFSDKIVSSRFMPYRFLNAVMINRMDIKKRFPRLGHYLTMIKRFFFRHKY
jgi:radical SAM superfamily enzyme YgiQ (UPF0313 family)